MRSGSLFIKLITTLVIVILAVLPLNSIAVAQTTTSLPTYTIQPGDTIGYVALLFGTTTAEILSVNPLSDPNFISPGDRLYIPGLPDGTLGELTLLQTQLGESFYDLTKKYQISPGQLSWINNLVSPTQVYVGSELIVTIPTQGGLLYPLTKINDGESIFELAISLEKNPYSILLLNSTNGLAALHKGMPVYDYSNDGPPVLSLLTPEFDKVEIAPLPLLQGNTEVIHVVSKTPVELNGELDGHPLHFFESEEGNYFALQGIHALAEPGLTEFVLTASLEDGRTLSFSQNILLKPGLFDIDPPLIVDPKTMDPDTAAKENEQVAKLISEITPTRHYQGMFTSPAVYQEYNSLFGTRRTYNDDPTVTFHAGVDFAGGITLPIFAPANGTVVFAGPLTIRGNTIFMDHGQGVYSGFFHQNKLNVQVGDFVTQGDIIGEVGNTGRVNRNGDYYGVGAHLHWEVWVNGVQVNPLDWLYNEYP